MLKTVYEKSIFATRNAEYFGKPKELIKAEKAMKVICATIDAKKNGDELDLIKYDLNINETKENKELIKCVQKQFGFKKLNINWDNTLSPGTCTMPSIGFIFDDDTPDIETIDHQKDGYYDRHHRYICSLILNMQLVRALNLTAGEHMAIMLHEIGHNFDTLVTARLRHVCIFAACAYGEKRTIDMILSMLQPYLASRLMKNYIFEIMGKYQDKYPLINRIVNAHGDIMYHANALLWLRKIYRLAMGTIRLVPDPWSVAIGLASRRGEYFADSFPAKYGYGPEFASAMYKFSHVAKIGGLSKDAVEKVPVLRTFYDLSVSPVIMLMSGSYEEHPYDENRMIGLQKDLERDYKSNDIPPELKPEIKKQIEAIKKIREQDIKDTDIQHPFTLARKMVMNTIMPELL